MGFENIYLEFHSSVRRSQVDKSKCMCFHKRCKLRHSSMDTVCMDLETRSIVQ
jgi:hypothetical protein